MTVAELIEELKKHDENMEVVCDYDGGYSTCGIYEVYIGHRFHNPDNEKVIVIE